MHLKLRTSYIICSTPRSGSTMLCDLLTATKVAGQPDSFFMDRFYSDWAAYWNVSTDSWGDYKKFDQRYINAAIQEGVGCTGVFGLRVQRESLEGLINRLKELYPNIRQDKGLLSKTFGTEHYIHLFRTDKVAQAISLLKAEQSGLWHVHADGTERERLRNGESSKYDFLKINKYYSKLKEHDAAWEAWFALQKIQPISVTYEYLCSDAQYVLTSILFSMGIDGLVSELVCPKTMKMSSRESNEWASRFRAELKEHNT